MAKSTPRRIYLDHAATTPLSLAARNAMLPYLNDCFGNPSSTHLEGRTSKTALDEARESVSAALGCLFGEVIFTSSGTEALQLALVGSALAEHKSTRTRVLVSASEHHAVLHTAPILERLGLQVELVPVDRQARISLDALENMLTEDVLLVAVQHANNETGILQPLDRVAELTHNACARLLVDAVQTFCYLSWTVDSFGADFVAVSAHKVGGPKGVGALYVRSGIKIEPTVRGGGQEREMRGGTENVAGIVGFGAAVARFNEWSDPDLIRAKSRDAFQSRLSELLGPLAEWTISQGDPRLGSHAHVRFVGTRAESLLIALDRAGVAASAGAACSSGSIEPSHVLLAGGWPTEHAAQALRFTTGVETTVQDAIEAADRVADAVRQVRGDTSTSAE